MSEILLLDKKNELHNREMHVSGKFTRKRDIDPIKQDIDPINDPINFKNLNGSENCKVVILEGIFIADWYRELFEAEIYFSVCNG